MTNKIPKLRTRGPFISKYIGNNDLIRVFKYVDNINLIERLEDNSRDYIDVCEWYKNGKPKMYHGNGIYVDTLMSAEWYEDGKLKYLSAQHNGGSMGDYRLIYRIKKDSSGNIVRMASYVNELDMFDINYKNKDEFEIIRHLETVIVTKHDVSLLRNEFDWFCFMTYDDPKTLERNEYLHKCKYELKKSTKFINEYEPYAIKRCNRIMQKYTNLLEKGEKEEYKKIIPAMTIDVSAEKFPWCYNDETNTVVALPRINNGKQIDLTKIIKIM
jgi:hypothetical protein